MRTILAIFLSAVLISGLNGCNIINPSEVVPTYIQIDSFNFNGRQLGPNSHKITNVWVYYNNNPVGNFDLPAKFPVIASAPGMLTVAPGIFYDGISSIPVIYPLYVADSLNFSPQPGTVINFKAETGYNSFVDTKFLETFDGGSGPNPFFTLRGGDTVMMNTTVPGEVFEGSGSGIISLRAGQDSAIVLSSGATMTPGRDAYIELDYRGTLTMRVGMHSELNAGGTYSDQIIGLNPRATWGKVYIGIKEWTASHPGSEYKILLRIDKPDGVSDGYMLVDNIKIVSF